MDVSTEGDTSEPELVYPERNNIEINEGKTLIVKCRAKGKPNPKIVWIKDSRHLVLGNNVNVQKEEVTSGGSQQLVSTLQISRIATKDAGNYTCKAENNHGSIQKWVYVAVQSLLSSTPATTIATHGIDSCPQYYCLNNGSCSSHPGGIRFCNCSYPYQGDRCERSLMPYKNFTESCKGKVLDCFHRTDRILTVTGIGLVLTMFFLILLISWYLSRQRRRDFDFWRQSKRENERYKCVQVGRPLWQQQQGGVRSVGTDVEYDLCQPEWPEIPPLPPPAVCAARLDSAGAAAVSMAASSTASLPAGRSPEPPTAFFYRPLRCLPDGSGGGGGDSGGGGGGREPMMASVVTLPPPRQHQRHHQPQQQRRLRPQQQQQLQHNEASPDSEIWIRRIGGGGGGSQLLQSAAAVASDDCAPDVGGCDGEAEGYTSQLHRPQQQQHRRQQHQEQRLCLCSEQGNQSRQQQQAVNAAAAADLCDFRVHHQVLAQPTAQQQQQQQQQQQRVQYYCHCPDPAAASGEETSFF